MPASGVETTIEKLLQISFVPHFYLFLWGVLLQRLRLYQYKILRNKGLLWVIAYLGYHFFIPATPLTIFFGNIFLGICVISLAYSYPDFAGKILKRTDISYGVYLYHGLVLGVLVQLKITGSIYCLIIVLVASYMLAFLSWKLIEQPFLKMKKKSLKLL
jgi:peptidoglycan/LPS O-acetylase OafA/YrhL